MTSSGHSNFLRSTIILTFANVGCRLLGFVYRLFFSSVFGEEGMGIYQLTGPVLSVCMALCVSGFLPGISAMSAGEEAEGRSPFRIVSAGIRYSLILSLLCIPAILPFRNAIAGTLLGEPRCAPLLVVLTFSIPFSALHSVINSYFCGIKRAPAAAFTQLFEQGLKLILLLTFRVIWKKVGPGDIPLSCAAVCYTAGEAGSAILSVFLLVKTLPPKSKLPLQSAHRREFHNPSRTLQSTAPDRQLLLLALPVCAGRLLSSFLSTMEQTRLPVSLQKYGLAPSEALSLFGALTGMALPVLFLPNALTGAFSAMLTPTVGAMASDNSRKRMETTLNRTITFCITFGTAACLFFFFGGPLLGDLLFHNERVGHLIRIGSFLCPFMYLASSLSGILNGLKKTFALFLAGMFSTVIRLCFTFFLVPVFGIDFYLMGMLTSQIFVSVFCLLLVRRNLSIISPETVPGPGSCNKKGDIV